MQKLLFLIIIFFISGCATKYNVNIKAIKSGQINTKSIKNISVLPFKKDTISQSSQIESVLNNLYINNQKYFNVINRKNLNDIINEKKLDYSGIVKTIHNNDFGISQVEALIIGSVDLNNISTSKFYETRTDKNTCIKTKTIYYKNNKSYTYCEKYRKYKVSCIKNKYNLQTTIKIIKVNNAKTIFAKVYDASTNYKHCIDDNVILPSKQEENSKLASIIAQRFITDIAPHYIYFSATLLDDLDIDIDDEKMFIASLELIKLNRIQKAFSILISLYNKYPNSYVITYDLAITFEALGNLQKAKQLLLEAENLSLKQGEVIPEIETSLQRINNNIEELNKAKQQL